MTFTKNSKNSQFDLQKDGTKLDFLGRETVLRYQTTEMELYPD